MERIGKGGDLVRESSYHEWPLFKEFRESDQFKNAYEKTFGYSFKAELERAAEKAEEEYELEAEFEEIGGDTHNKGAVPAAENDSAPEQ